MRGRALGDGRWEILPSFNVLSAVCCLGLVAHVKALRPRSGRVDGRAAPRAAPPEMGSPGTVAGRRDRLPDVCVVVCPLLGSSADPAEWQSGRR